MRFRRVLKFRGIHARLRRRLRQRLRLMARVAKVTLVRLPPILSLFLSLFPPPSLTSVETPSPSRTKESAHLSISH